MTSLLPGSGFTGQSSAGSPIGTQGAPGYDKTPITRWNIIPLQVVDEAFEVGVVAFHINGIEYVELSANGGPWVRVSQMTVNPRTGSREFWATLQTDAASADLIELRARVMPFETGTPVVLQHSVENADDYRAFGDFADGVHSIFLWGPAAFSTAQTRYVSVDGNDANPGNESMPFQTIGKALSELKALVGLERCEVIILTPGEYYGGSTATWTDGDTWMTIRAADGLDPSDPETRVLIEGEATELHYMKPKASLVHWKNVAFDAETCHYLQSQEDEYAWFDGCFFFDSLGWGTPRAHIILNKNGSNRQGWSATNCDVYNKRDGFNGGQLVRNCHINGMTRDSFTNTRLVIDCSVEHFHRIVADEHCDLYQLFGSLGDEMVNYICFGLRAWDLKEVQLIMLGKYPTRRNLAVVDLAVDMEPHPNLKSNLNSIAEHWVLLNISIPEQQLIFKDAETNDPTNPPFTADDVLLANMTIAWMQRADFFADGIPNGVQFLNSHLGAQGNIDNNDAGVSNLSVGELVLESTNGIDWVYSGLGVPLIHGTGLPIPGFLLPLVDKGFVVSSE
jgi:hypothetical protein